MEIFDLLKIGSEAYEKREMNVFFENDLFKTRIIDLKAGQSIPKCQMLGYVMFYAVKGEVLLRKNDETQTLKENCLFITEPAFLSMETALGARLLGIQIKPKE